MAVGDEKTPSAFGVKKKLNGRKPMLKSLIDLTTDVARTVTAPVEITADLARVVTKPVADAAEDVAKTVKETTKDITED